MIETRAASAYSYPLLLRHLWHTPLNNTPGQEIVSGEGLRYDYATLYERVGHLAMDTDKFASIVLEQIGDGQFYIVSHAYNMVRIQERYDEIARAYERYAPRYEGDEEFDVRHLIQTQFGTR